MRRRAVIIGATLLGVGLVLRLAPAAIARLVVPSLLADQALVLEGLGTLDINLFTLDANAEGLRLHSKGAIGGVGLARLDLSLSAADVLRGRLHIDRAHLSGLTLKLEDQGRPGIGIAGLVLPAPSTQDQPSRPWPLGLSDLKLSDSRVTIALDDVTGDLAIDAVRLDQLLAWAPDDGEGHLALTLADGTIAARVRPRPFLATPSLALDVTVDGVRLGQLGLEGIRDGVLDLTTDLRLLLTAVPQLAGSADVSVAGLDVEGREGWVLGGNAAIAAGRFTLDLPADAMPVVAADAVMIEASDLKLAVENEALASLRSIRAEGVRFQDNRADIEQIMLAAPKATLTRTAAGIAELAGLMPAADASARPPPGLQPSSPRPDLHIGTIELVEPGLIDFRDRSHATPARFMVALEEAAFGPIDSSRPALLSDYRLALRVGEFSTLVSNGRIAPLMGNAPDFTTKTRLNDFELPSLSPYSRDALGLKLDRGQFSMTIDAAAEAGSLTGTNRLLLRGLAIEQVEAADGQTLSERVGMPIGTALSLLRKGDGGIDLDIPVSGDINDPAFDISDAVNTALGNAVKTATLGVAKTAFKGATLPFSTFIKLIGADGKISLDPVAFAPGLSDLSPGAIDALARIGPLMQARPGLSLTVCGVAALADRDQLRARPTKDGDAAPDVDAAAEQAALVDLAQTRARTIKGHLITVHGVAPDRIFECDVAAETMQALDAMDAGIPRVRLKLG